MEEWFLPAAHLHWQDPPVRSHLWDKSHIDLLMPLCELLWGMGRMREFMRAAGLN